MSYSCIKGQKDKVSPAVNLSQMNDGKLQEMLEKHKTRGKFKNKLLVEIAKRNSRKNA